MAKTKLKLDRDIYNRKRGLYLEFGNKYLTDRYKKLKTSNPQFQGFLELYKCMSWDPYHALAPALILEDVLSDSSKDGSPEISTHTIRWARNQFSRSPKEYVNNILKDVPQDERIAVDIITEIIRHTMSRQDMLSVGAFSYIMFKKEVTNKEQGSFTPKEDLIIWDRKKSDGKHDLNYLPIVRNPEVDHLITPFAEKSWNRLRVYLESVKVYKYISETNGGNFPKISKKFKDDTLKDFLDNPFDYVMKSMTEMKKNNSCLHDIIFTGGQSSEYAEQEIWTLGVMLNHLNEASK